jgi:hypothetical protein
MSHPADDSLLTAAVKGAVAGALGTAVVTLGMQRGPALMERYGLADQGELTEMGGEEPTAKLAEQVSETVLDRPLDPQTKQTTGQAVHWGYGIAWGALYGMAQHSLRWPAPLAGLAFGALVGTVASTVVPAMQLTPPPTEQPLPHVEMMSTLHLAYGEVTALAFEALEELV